MVKRQVDIIYFFRKYTCVLLILLQNEHTYVPPFKHISDKNAYFNRQDPLRIRNKIKIYFKLTSPITSPKKPKAITFSFNHFANDK